MIPMNRVTREQALSRVQAGLLYVDTNTPGGSAAIRIGTLNIASTSCCILAQAAGENYWGACTARGLNQRRAAELGFQTMSDNPAAEFRLLTDVCKEELQRRRYGTERIAVTA